MGAEGGTIRLYTSQSHEVVKLLKEQKVIHVKREYIIKKYQEVSHVFLEGYDWFVSKAPAIVKKPPEAEYPYWAFTEPEYAGWMPDIVMLTLEVPVEEAVFFRVEDWYKILNLSYLPKDEKDQQSFNKLLDNYGIKNKMDIFTKPYYPDLKQKIKKSWDNLFVYHNPVQNGTGKEFHIQAGLWELKLEWVVNLNNNI